ncbi:YdcF family protein [Xenorhabdus sp. 12]|uniref:YdcF family protein n=1 Tax=Xenorhabdus santafensis TaxID=2582833 RepID=A0ABU4S592_9GAMM|nr:YdcF family protein [Xenorhabdus sp. 12]MDX7986176.1 YdcF family protein [Xenorhabdus sp. 12]
MTLTMLIVIIVLAASCAAFKWRRTSRTLYAILIILFLAIGCGPIPAWLLSNLQSAYDVKPTIAWSKRNAIVLLGAGTEKIARTNSVEPGTFSYARIVEAAELYNDCRKTKADCKIIVSGGDANHTGSPEATVYRSSLLKLGIDAADVFLESNSMNTWQNAQFTSSVLRRYNPDRVLLVSSGIHLRRSVLYFAHFGVAALPVRADYLRAVLSPLPLSYNFAVADFALHEYVGIARYYVYNALGWNPMRQHPGDA